MLQDLRFAVRTFLKNPGFTLVVVLTLALGIGANTAIFSIIDALMLKPLPVAHPERLVEPLIVFGPDSRFNAFSWQTYKLLRDNNTVFSGLITCPTDRFHVTTESGDPERVEGEYVTGNFFPVLGVKPAIGRLIAPEDERLGAPNPVAVVTYGYWKRHFALDPAVLGKRISVEDVPLTIIGVTPPAFFGLQVGRTEDISIPLAMEPVIRKESQMRSAGFKWMRVLARLKPGVSISEAHAQTSGVVSWNGAGRGAHRRFGIPAKNSQLATRRRARRRGTLPASRPVLAAAIGSYGDHRSGAVDSVRERCDALARAKRRTPA